MQPSERALRSLDEARRLYSAEGDRLMDANCAFMMAAILVRDLGNVAPAQQLARDSLGIFEKLGSEHEQAHARSVLAEIDYRRDRTPQAADVAHDCLQTFRRAADHRCESAMLLLLARIEQDQGDRDMAVRLLRETLDVAASGAHARTLPLAVERLARLFSQDQPLAAVARFAAVDAYRDTSARSSKPERAAELDTLRHATQPEAFDAAWQRGARVPRRDHGLTLTNCGKVAAGLGHPDAARAVAWRTGRTRSRSSWRATG
jgi:tetratricopeptide (TPR) repeat protein